MVQGHWGTAMVVSGVILGHRFAYFVLKLKDYKPDLLLVINEALSCGYCSEK